MFAMCLRYEVSTELIKRTPQLIFLKGKSNSMSKGYEWTIPQRRNRNYP